MSDSVRPHGLSPTRLLCPSDFPDRNTGVGCHSLLQGIFPTQGSDLGLMHCRQILYGLSHQGSPRILEWAAYPFSRGSSWLNSYSLYSQKGVFRKENAKLSDTRLLKSSPGFPVSLLCIFEVEGPRFEKHGGLGNEGGVLTLSHTAAWEWSLRRGAFVVSLLVLPEGAGCSGRPPSTGADSNWFPVMLPMSSVLHFHPVMGSIVIICCLVTRSCHISP